MSIEVFQNQVRNLVGQAKTDDAIKIIESWVNQEGTSDSQNGIAMIKSDWLKLKRDENIGIAENSHKTRATINYRILNFEWETKHIDKPNPITNSNSEIMKILFIASNPSDQTRIETDREHRIIKSEMERGSHRHKFEFLPPQFAVTITELLRAMNDKPQIVHFSGHGEEKGIIITTDSNTTQLLPISAIKRLFRPLENVAKVVLLNSCYSAAQAMEISKFGFYVVGYSEPIGDAAAIGFAQGLYNGLGENKSFEDAYNDAMIVLLTVGADYADIVEVWKDEKKLEL